MNQQELRDTEYRCIQEEQPTCQAACPISVDVRGFMAKMAAGDLSGARKILDRTMPLPGVLARLCDHPCENACLRATLGGALTVGALERACVLATSAGAKPMCMPSKGKTVAALGGDLSSLTLAWDLAKKGFRVTVYAAADKAGGKLNEISPDMLPSDVLAEALDMLGRMGVAVKTGQTLDAARLEALAAECDAVYVECAGRDLCGISRADADVVTLQGPRPNVFCGGWPRPDGSRSIISLVTDGRRAAMSIDRFISGASLTTSREKEGVTTTRTYTNLKGVPAVARVEPADPVAGFAPEDAKTEAARCMQCDCMECVKVCEYLKHYKGYPKLYARQIYNNLSIVLGNHYLNRMIDSCTLCGLCTEVCPEDFSMAELCLHSRRDMVKRGKMPPSAHEFALEDMAFSNGPDCALVRTEPGQDACAHLFFPGCQLAGEPDGRIPEAYAFLRQKLSGGVGLALGCCGAPALWAGRDPLFEEVVVAFKAQWEKLGKPRLITACSSCLSVFQQAAPEIPAVSLWQVMESETGLPETAGFSPAAPVAVHDSCTSRHNEPLQRAVRALLAKRGVTFEELPLSGRYTECCGFGGLAGNAHPQLAKAITERRAAASDKDFLATCAMCRDRLSHVGKRAYHLLDVLFPGQDAGDPAARPDPGFSMRHETRARLRRHMLTTVWNETVDAKAPIGPDFVVSPEVRARMEARHILDDDVKRTLAHAETTGRKFLDRETGHFLASFTPHRVTYWVEYVMEGDTARVFTAYSHRMNVDNVGK
ncbi:4Fe-4S ferredoxin iron-sulfur binding domain protein [Solidesulfovibrio fructosivorans JJ]]|uniref:4Fe-4S ferredoxin iron-sulfur binding domain protein n=1 Tax=Solidesulfovibrio fructosivorans JJ] TaxID=596151 RepID=E1JYE1_SOLFR|nr:pyridine nucleotide-disulfide oxidoreductase/dicluster-binding protein [Solidesulfovibrio fructosivorans]EFL50620.1 4Fe-4S ferredoxin iron-sulfur binding domain protein [Solidesulfovibrio fructosivorans JJ]]